MARDWPITVVAKSAKKGRCRHCGARVTLVVTASRPRTATRAGKASKTLPFDGTPFGTNFRTMDSGVSFEDWPAASLHFRTCPYHLAKRPAPRPQTGRLWD